MIKFNITKAAMFGLDARIALAIFGALSVISGASLYSAIQQAKATAILTEMQEFGKAWEQYYLDTGTALEQAEKLDNTDDDFYRLRISYLVNTSGLSGWNGPYLPYNIVNSIALDSKDYGNWAINILRKDINWGEASNNNWITAKCTSGNDCQVWIMLNGIKNESLAQIIDQKVDGGDGSDSGSFRWWLGNEGPTNWRYHLEYSPISNPND